MKHNSHEALLHFGLSAGVFLVLSSCSEARHAGRADYFEKDARSDSDVASPFDAPHSGLGGANGGPSQCLCKTGMTANSQEECEDEDECAKGKHTCDPTSGLCQNTWGGFGCSCAEGTFGDGHFCKPISACAAHPCENGGECIETLSERGFACACPLGTSGIRCEDEESCARSAVLAVIPPLSEFLRGQLQLLPEQELTVGSLEGHYGLDLSESPVPIDSLTGLECWTTLNELSAPQQALTDLSPLRELHLLFELDVTCNNIASLSPLENHVLMQELHLGADDGCDSSIPEDAPPNIGTLLGLKHLSIHAPHLRDAAFLEACSQLRSLRGSEMLLQDAMNSEAFAQLSNCANGGQ